LPCGGRVIHTTAVCASYLPTDFKYREERTSEKYQSNYAMDHSSRTEVFDDGQDPQRHHKGVGTHRAIKRRLCSGVVEAIESM